MNWITPHSFLSLSWDEWASVILVAGTCLALLKRLTSRGVHDVIDPIVRNINRLTNAIEQTNRQQAKLNKRLEDGDRQLYHHEERIQDHERRITRLEDKDNE